MPRMPWLPTPAELRALIWYHLERNHDQRPRVADLATALGMTPRHFRRAWHLTDYESLRHQIMLGCLSHGAWQIYANGEKAMAAARMSGFGSYWNFNRELKKHCGCTASTCRVRFPFPFDAADILDKVEALREKATERSEQTSFRRDA